jgi:S-formylglutathione hydrolase FrmB
MTRQFKISARSISLFFTLCAAVCASFIEARAAVHFKVTLDSSVATGAAPVSGRLLIFMTKSDKPLDMIGLDFTNPNAVWISGMEVANLTPGKSVTIDADSLSFPAAFSTAPAGEYQVMALVDSNHSYTYYLGPDGGDIYSAVQKVTMPAAETSLTLSKIVPKVVPQPHPNRKIVEFESPMLSSFWGRPIKMQASVVLPLDYEESKTTRYPTAYIIHGYGGGFVPPIAAVDRAMEQMKTGEIPKMIYVFLNAHNSLGHHVFADSANNGPWGTALTAEFIPYLEKQFRMDAKPSGRFLTGHSSGGWSTLWIMVTHPDFFGGTWSTSPDPVDFHNFTGPNLYQPGQNAYMDANGKEYGLVRVGGKDLATVKQYTQQEVVLGEYGGQFGSFNAVFSPKGPDGRPMKLFDIETGVSDPDVIKSWEKYDISLLLRENWQTLGPKLKGKIHIVVGTADTFHLDEPTRLLDAELKKLGSDAKIEYLEGRDHFNLYQGGLRERFFKEMYAIARPAVKTATAK